MTRMPISPAMERLSLPLTNRPYEILIGAGLLTALPDHLDKLLKRPFLPIITDAHLANSWLEPVQDALKAQGIDCPPIILPAGEATKSMAKLEAVLDELLALRVERRDHILALGGGVIGDLTGFAAAILRRGVNFIQAPTSLLAQVDSSVGGKTGINSRHGKNLIGAFHQPSRVIIDLEVLKSLPHRELLAGLAEVIKYGLIDNPDFFFWLEQNMARLLSGDQAAQAYAIKHSCAAKAAIVAQDEHEQGLRALLNFGHTFGHGLEALMGFDGRLLHGEAVAIGMVMAMDYCVSQGLCPQIEADRTRALIRSTGLPVAPPVFIDPAAMLQAMMQDKKVEAGALTLILSRGIGRCYIEKQVDSAKVGAFLETWLGKHHPQQKEQV